VTTRGNNTRIEFRVASPDEADDVLSVLDEAAAWLQEQGITQWPGRFELAWISDAIREGETWLVEVDGRISATVTDPVWGDADGSAAYIHRMAVRRQEPGLGAVILAWVADSRRHGRDAVRLDRVASNDRLRAYYVRAGFLYRGNVAVGTGPATWVSRYEMRVA
jgi:hypothetical protein